MTQNLLCLTEYSKKLTPQKVSFDKEPMWVQFHGLPFGMIKRSCGYWIAMQIGEELDIDVDTDGLDWGPFLKVKVWVNITKPFLCGSVLTIEGI